VNLTRTIVTLSALTLTGCAGTSAASDTTVPPFTITGTINITGLTNSTGVEATRTCAGNGAFGELRDGTQVVVTDQAGTTIALGSVVGSHVNPADVVFDSPTKCTLNFRVDGVPAGKGFYGVEMAHRGRSQYTEAQARAPIALPDVP
jgi:hypothetical protein